MMIFLYILLFILFLSILIVVHECGHLTAAKIFKVYCHDFSIGFGPAFFHKRRKGGETYFSLRAIPFGGFVSMYGEGAEELDEFKDVDPSRSLQAIKKWKQAIIMVAGVTMNIVLAIVLLFISEQACVHYNFYLNWATVKEGSIAYNAGVTVDKGIAMHTCQDKDGNSTSYVWLDKTAHFDDDTTTDYWVVLNQSSFNKNHTNYNEMLSVFGTTTRTVEGKEVKIADFISQDLTKHTSLKFTISNCDYKIENINGTNYLSVVEGSEVPHAINAPITDGKIAELGMDFLIESYWNNYQGTTTKNGVYDDRNALRKTFVDFGNSAVIIFKGLGSLFTKEGWQNVGGIVAIGVTTSQTLENFGVAQFLFYWGLISVNLAIVNIFPFPGLDGWHLLVIGIEAISRKKVPQKAKAIVSYIGIALLFALMIAIIVKDILRYI